MKNSMLPRISRSALYAAALLVPASNAQATDPGTGDDWRYNASLYLWGAGVGGETAFDRNLGGSSDIDVGFDTVIENLNGLRVPESGIETTVYVRAAARREPVLSPRG